MARLIGTGKGPDGRIDKGMVVDSPKGSAEYNEMLEKGWATEVAPEDAPGTKPLEVANNIVRAGSDTDISALNPAAAAVTAKLEKDGVDPHDAVHAQSAHSEDVPQQGTEGSSSSAGPAEDVNHVGKTRQREDGGVAGGNEADTGDSGDKSDSAKSGTGKK